jgi:hypothetical protein
LFADIELRGELTKLFASLTGLSAETQSIGVRDELDSGLSRHRSYDTPWLAGSAMLRQRRRSA